MMKETILDWLDRRVANLIMICITVLFVTGLPILSVGIILISLEGILGDVDILREVINQVISICGAVCGVAIAILIFPLVPAHIVLHNRNKDKEDRN
jgi:hypothetical protein|nr:MAG TPA: hypothetical protein [Caudoviricetes sp.]